MRSKEFGDSVIFVIIFSTMSSLGCANVQEPEHASPIAQGVDSTIAGYTHDLSRSRFRIGQGPVLEQSAPIQRWRGSLGTFAADPTNGFVYASIDAQTPPGPYLLDEATHAARVKAYFVDAGLPADQIRDVQATYTSTVISGSMSMSASPSAQLESINTILRRQVAGIPVVESEAWAKMTISGDVDLEYVFWPSISGSVVQQAVAFGNKMASSAAHGEFVGRLPGLVAQDIGVVIHHTDVGVHAPATAFASYDVVIESGMRRGSRPAARHFDINGNEFRLPQEAPETFSQAVPASR